ncbi:MAG: nucleotidyltransferase [Candidatus Scalindua rubra]|uniref:Nucleotidyltransferase n=1 Tax=Candidatus Scalindua rubra TaxID=1872076 RepID=A0A1E3X6D7_9BACT|nr:MAG: nucleotidyltransferase [Candidatus Scalindua rubra]
MDDFKSYTLKDKQKEDVVSLVKHELESRVEIIFSYIYGSFIESEMPFFRDIDIGVYVSKDIVLPDQFIDYTLSLSLEIESFLNRYPIDVVVMNDAPLTLLFKITQGRLLFAKNEDLWTDLVTKTWALYHDHNITSRDLLEQLIKA